MRHIISLIGAGMTAAAVIPASAHPADPEPSATSLFIDAPTSVIMIDSFPKLEMLEYYRAGSTHTTPTIIGTPARVVSETPDKVRFKVGDMADFQVLSLPSKKQPLTALIETLSGAVTDSRISFFDSKWQPVDSKNIFPEPGIAEWLTPQGKARGASLLDDIPFITAEYTYDPDTMTLTATLTLGQYFTDDDWARLSPYFKPTLSYTWNPSGSFKLKKD